MAEGTVIREGDKGEGIMTEFARYRQIINIRENHIDMYVNIYHRNNRMFRYKVLHFFGERF